MVQNPVWRGNDSLEGPVRQGAGDIQLASALVMELLRPLVERDALGSSVDGAESGDAELLAGLHNSGGPSTVFLHELFAFLELLLRHYLASGVFHQVGLDQ